MAVLRWNNDCSYIRLTVESSEKREFLVKEQKQMKRGIDIGR